MQLVPLQLTYLGVNHLLHYGGTGVILYRLNQPAQESGVMVGGRFFRGYPKPKGARGEYSAFFPIPLEPGPTLQVDLVARPAAGQEVRQRVTLKLKPRKWRDDRITMSDAAIGQLISKFPVAHPQDPVKAFLEINRDLRRANHERVRQACARSHPQPLWTRRLPALPGQALGPLRRETDLRGAGQSRGSADSSGRRPGQPGT